ncbi:PIN domain-containing protein [Bradyrhizobium sp. JYMT SZCCT0428]|uniref:type II toxin-antitoxin system VapC family toxin n=1 Tax=Bradyrhizobium sp. JYMT SZCCT0428 TaxID=2807673 RepID=UPI001BA7128C|nr:PIN domain-containing protein [Bradyrhizobium sp. JYMT SZCCT0428]MBR1149846.1 PIN domain-containing protein [Bradyrhizobium sp. JYMT SZCCT0428]
MAIVVFDASFLIPLLDPRVKGFGEVDVKLLHLVQTLDKQRDVVVIPTPALSELLIGAGDAAPHYLDILNRTPRFKVAAFGPRAAVEAAERHRQALRNNDKKEGAESWAKLKFDRQIIAIAKVEGADRIYSNDDDIRRYSKAEALEVIRLEDLPEPPEKTPDLFDKL